MALTDPKIKQAKAKDKDYKLSDEKGLFLLVKKTGAKYWRMKYRFAGKEKLMAFGVYPDVTLKEARAHGEEARKQLRAGIDPNAAKKAEKQKENNSFELVAREWYAKKKPHWSESHCVRVLRGLENDLLPSLGDMPIDIISASDLLTALRKIEAREAFESARKVKQIAGQIFRYGIATARCKHDISADLREALQQPVVKHFAAITEPKEVGRLMVAIDGFQGTVTVKAALQLSPLLFQRPGEIRHMEWKEINWEEERWEIPAEKMKLREPHIVPLCKQALAILEQQELLTGRGRYVLPSQRGASRPLSENGVRVALRTMGFDNETITPHGFRAMARTILDEVLGFRVDWIEQQLAHAVKDANGRAYNRTKHLEQRRNMMQKWADYLDDLRLQVNSDNIISFIRAKD